MILRVLSLSRRYGPGLSIPTSFAILARTSVTNLLGSGGLTWRYRMLWAGMCG